MVAHAQALQRLNRVPESIDAYKGILRRWPNEALCWFNLGVLQRKSRNLDAALQSYQKALDLGISEPEEVHLNRGVIYADYLRNDELAEQELRRALALNPDYVPALLNLANLHEDLGRAEAAATVYERILELNPRHFEALARYANLRLGAPPGADLARRLKAALDDPGATDAEKASVGFALGGVYDARGEYEAAFDAYTAANRHSRASGAPHLIDYNRAQQEELIRQLISASHHLRGSAPLTRKSAHRSPAPAPARPGARAGAAPQPIFICGMFRSGSTLTEQLLAGHPAISAGGELDILPRLAALNLASFPESLRSISPQRLQGMADAYLDELAKVFPGATYVIDKRPDNFLHIGLIKTLFPEAKIVHTVRDPLDNCLSIFFLHLDHGMSYALDLLNIGHYYREYQRLMRHWKQLYPVDIADFDYDSFVSRPSAIAAGLFEFLGLEWDDRYLERPAPGRAVKTASVWQVREPIYTRSSGRAAHYAPQLAELRRYLAELPPI
jgi:tetratricopeptide (TPR) repeat protein